MGVIMIDFICIDTGRGFFFLMFTNSGVKSLVVFFFVFFSYEIRLEREKHEPPSLLLFFVPACLLPTHSYSTIPDT